MTKMRDFEVGDVLPESFLDALNEALSSLASNLVLELENATTIRIPAATGAGQASVAVNGLWRWITGNLSAVSPGGGATTHSVWVVASANNIGGGDVDSTDYTFGLRITTGSAPTGNHGGSPITVTRKVGEAEWNGSQYVTLRNVTSGAQPPVLLASPVASVTPFRVRGATSQSAKLIVAEDAGGTEQASVSAAGVMNASGFTLGGVGLQAAAHMSGTIGARPSAGSVAEGTLYWATDSLVLARATGGSWLSLAAAPADNTVSTAKIVDAAITSAKIADAAVTSAKIADGTVSIGDLAAAVADRLVPAGVIAATAAAAAPTGWLLCNGLTQLRASYADLFAAIGTEYNTGGESGSDFRLPNLKGRVPVGFDGGQAEFDGLGDTGGAKTHQLTEAELAVHDHDLEGDGAGNYLRDEGADAVVTYEYTYPNNGPGGHLIKRSSRPGITDAGSGVAHNNLQPFQVVNWIIKT